MADDEAAPQEPERIEVVVEPCARGATWQPTVGEETVALFEHLRLPPDIRQTVLDEALAVLSRCPAPVDMSGQRVGLVIGYVQSGKTMSFTALSALARDNGYPLIIVITGISTSLLGQSRDRLRRDLRLDARNDHAWQHFDYPRNTADRQAIRDTLDGWHDPVSRRYGSPPTALVTVMKHHGHLANLTAILRDLPLQNTPTIIIDDEADQAGLNTRANQGDQSTTYQCLLNLRAAVPCHAFLQYTATPQAPLLIALIDALAPEFAAVLTPGPDYVGGSVFFRDHPHLVRVIPPADLPDGDGPLTEAPDSLLAAMRLFFLGVAAGWVRDRRHGNRSMLVHPSRETSLHREFCDIVTQVKEDWQELLSGPDDEPDRQDLLAEFRAAYADLVQTAEDLPPFDELAECLAPAIRSTRVWEMNAATGETPHIEWRGTYSHILVGGQALDRGFTVEGLTVTYMPRGVGIRNADTVQQRARFLGYKREYLGYCRVYLEQTLQAAYTDYVEHEETLRQQVADHGRTGRPLAEWRRAFFLTTQLRPTRAAVLTLDYLRGQFSDEWFYPRSPHSDPATAQSNNAAIEGFLATVDLRPSDGHPERTAAQRHLVDFQVSLARLYQELLTRLRFSSPDDSHRLTGLLLQVDRYLCESGDAPCAVYLMGIDDGHEARVRGVDDRGHILNLFQGAHPSTPRHLQGTIYPGDHKIRSSQGLTLQIHRLTLTEGTQRRVLYARIPTVAVWVPHEMGADWLVQEEQNAHT